MTYDAILLIAFGAPEKLEDVRPFLANVLRGRPVPSSRIEEVVGHYEALGGRSLLTEITLRQARALGRRLAEDGLPIPVHVGMRNWHPYIAETLERMAEGGIRRALGLILSVHQSEAGWDRYQKDVEEARGRLGSKAPLVDFAPGWHDHPRFIEVQAELVGAALAQVEAESRPHTPLLFTAHSLPAAAAGVSEYTAQVADTAARVAGRLGHSRWSVAYQSRSGDPRTPWLEPDIDKAMAELGASGAREVVIAPIGFVCDHVEVLYDLDIANRRLAAKHGMRQIRAATANDHPIFIAMLADVVQDAFGSRPGGGPKP